jgi:hypothetical protein
MNSGSTNPVSVTLFFFNFGTGSYYVALVDLKLAILLLSLLNSGNTGMLHYAQLSFILNSQKLEKSKCP